jgi:hypothetical protein
MTTESRPVRSPILKERTVDPNTTTSLKADPSTLTLAERLLAQAAKKAKKRPDKKNSTADQSQADPEVRPTLKYTIGTQELLLQAKIVAEKSKLGILESIFKVLERAIKARKRRAAWFSEADINNGYSTEGHLHFIEVLEKAIEILKLRIERVAPLSPPKAAQGKADKKSSNIFDVLKVEDTAEIAETTRTLQSLSTQSNSK